LDVGQGLRRAGHRQWLRLQVAERLVDLVAADHRSGGRAPRGSQLAEQFAPAVQQLLQLFGLDLLVDLGCLDRLARPCGMRTLWVTGKRLTASTGGRSRAACIVARRATCSATI